ncbi:MAG: hypothetical protein G01um101430_483 [Parcubacteria group bacterium Gr01-1014_30]|nr:MAG: hypothetical protein G01um101430_483 [Parcubacteria group bacterium Gr01-1014_30]
MTVATIPKELTRKGELVVIPRREYEDYLRFKITEVRRSKAKIDAGLRKSLQELRQGKAVGPFGSAKDLMKSLKFVR